jgi:hypothetical protein
VPFALARMNFSPESGQMVVGAEPVVGWAQKVQQLLPNPNTPILVFCTNGTDYSIDALTALEEAGYTTLVGLK